jgi:hypothetical protein
MITGNEKVNPEITTDFRWFKGDQTLNYSDVHSKGGITLRQYYAGLAMKGILSSCDVENNPYIDADNLARQSVIYSDALIAELNKEKP